MQASISRVFIDGESQTVCIPQEFRLETNRVEISRNAEGDLVLHPLTVDRGLALFESLSAFDEDFVALLEEDQWE